jgi:phosphoribosylglycinamide formyltransferase-1
MVSHENKTRLVILISGRGSNMRSIIDAINAQQINATVSAVISNRPDAAGLNYAKDLSIATEVIDHKGFSDRDSFDRALAERIDDYKPDFVILAGFMRILTAEFVEHYHNRLINIHPSLLPKFKGLNTHQRAIDAGEKEHGASVHFVTAELDDGPVIMQAKVSVMPDDSAESLAARVLEQEHQLYPAAIQKLVNSKQDK